MRKRERSITKIVKLSEACVRDLCQKLHDIRRDIDNEQYRGGGVPSLELEIDNKKLKSKLVIIVHDVRINHTSKPSLSFWGQFCIKYDEANHAVFRYLIGHGYNPYTTLYVYGQNDENGKIQSIELRTDIKPY